MWEVFFGRTLYAKFGVITEETELIIPMWLCSLKHKSDNVLLFNFSFIYLYE